MADATTAVQVFDNEEFGKIRGMTIEGVPYFVAADICQALEIGNPSQALTRLKDSEKMTITNNEGHSGKRGGAQKLNLVNEPGLYRLIFTSRKPDAEKFQDWVYHEVLPSIRKTGGYSINVSTLNMPRPVELIREIGDTSDELQRVFGIGVERRGMALAEAIDRLSKFYQVDLTSLNKLLPPVERDSVGYMNATQIGEKLDNRSAQQIIRALQATGLLKVEVVGGNRNYIVTEQGAEYGEMKPYVNEKNGHSGYHVQWNEKVLPILENYFASQKSWIPF